MLLAPSSSTAVANIAPPEQRGAYFGLFWIATSLGYTAGPLLGGLLLHISPFLCWSVLLIIGLLGSGLSWLIPQSATHVIYSKETGKS